MLIVKKLRKEFNNVTAVNDLSFQVNAGEIFGLIGPNGAGKTTAIRCLLNIIKPTSGEIIFNGSTANHKFKDQVGYLPEERGLYSKSKVIDVIYYFGELRGLNRSEVKSRVKHYLRKLEIENYANKKVNELSKGNQQKVQFVTSIVNEPKVLILDEPFAGLDPINQLLIKDIILEFLDEGRLIILSTHQMDIAEKLCSQILLIDQGVEVLHGKLSEIKKNFGKISITIKSNQIGNEIKNYPEVLSADVYENYSEIILKSEFQPSSFLRKIIYDYEINGFEIKEPSLHSIFIEAVSRSNQKNN